ncbi:MAG: 4-(cytidine 5'-diphospho)-2-C-methyl-D-erythritol kinase [Planctomycetota bacterium]|nr:4-(cytidine 5'-diphospho)-2-C-methyl-D-erythritol kinase [Planctomycetota bacterium]
MNGPWVRALAPAKVNLTLAVLGKRPDGFHEIRSWMLALSLVDVVRVRATSTGGVRIVVRGDAATPDVPLDDRNLAVRAAQAVLYEARARGLASLGAGLEIDLTKSIPSQAGLGGGSSDAAAAWVAARAALAVELDDACAEAALARLGSDCVFFQKAHRGIGIATGRGERIEALSRPLPRWSIALVTPACGAPTAAVYARALPRDAERPTLPPRITEAASDACGSIENDLEAAAIAAVPVLGTWRALLDELGLRDWRLCGSGSSWFGIHDSDAEAHAALLRVENAARDRGLRLRLARVVRAAGHGAVLAPES